MSSFFILTLLQYLFGAGYLVTIYNMKKLALCLLLLFSFPAVSSAQIYTAGSGYYPKEPSVLFPWEASLGLTGSFSPVKEANGERLINLQGGVSARVLYYWAPWMGIGLEGTWFSSESGSSLIDKFCMRRGGVVGKFIAASETSTRSYGLLAAGFTRREAEYSFDLKEHKTSAYFAFGLGVETDVSDSSFIGAEVRGIYNTSSDVGHFSYLVSHWEAEGSLRFGVRF